jgi:hypothetical protein
MRDLSHDSPDANTDREMESRLTRGNPRAGDAVTTHLRPPRGETQSRLARGQLHAGDVGTTRPRPPPGGRHSHDSPVDNHGWEIQSRLAQGQPQTSSAFLTHPRPSQAMLRKVPNFADQICKADRLTNYPPTDSPEGTTMWETQSRLVRGQPRAGDAVTTHPRPISSGRCSHDSPKTNLGQETPSQLARGQPCAGDTVATRSRPTLCGRQAQLTRGQPRTGHAVATRSRPTPGGRRSRLAQGQPQAGDTITARPRPTSDKQHIFDSSEGISNDASKGAQLRRPTLQGGPADQLYADQLCEADQLTNSLMTKTLMTNSLSVGVWTRGPNQPVK